MPVFARTKLMIHEDCLAPPGAPFVIINYSGPNPQNIYPQIKKLFGTIFKAAESELQERNFFWDRSGAVEKFGVTFDMIRDLDAFSFMQIIVDLSGEAKPSKEFGKEGSATIRIDGRIRTEYPQDTLWQRSLLYEMFRVFYHRVIYEEKRRKYKEQCREMISGFQTHLKSFLNILPKSSSG